MTLASEPCEACHKGAPKVTAEEQADLIKQLPDWTVKTVNDIPRLTRTFTFDGWNPAVVFTDAVAAAANATDHHPRIVLEWGKVTVSWWTHAIGGLHRNDFVMAAKTDEIAATR